MAKYFYTLYDPETYDVLCVSEFEEQPLNSTKKMVTEQWAKPRYNPETDSFYNAATEQEQEDFITAKNRAAEYSVKWANRPEWLTEQTAESLNEAFPDCPLPFTVYAPNIGSGTKYEKSATGIWVAFTSTL